MASTSRAADAVANVVDLDADCGYNGCRKCQVSLLSGAGLFSELEDCWTFLLRHGVVQCHVKCIRCGNIMEISRPGRQMLRCRKLNRKSGRVCTYAVSNLSGTFFAKARMTIPKVMSFVMLFFTMRPPRQRFIMRELHLTAHTVVDWSSFVREVLIHHATSEHRMIGGPGIVVEIDEAKVGRRKYNRGRYLTGQWIFGGVERGNRTNFFVVPVEDRTAETLMRIIRARIRPGTTVMSDCWRAYAGVGNDDFTHFTVNHSLNFVDPDTGAHTQNIERAWVEVRKNLPRFGRKSAHYEGYLADVRFRMAYPDHRDRIHAFWKMAAELYPGLQHP